MNSKLFLIPFILAGATASFAPSAAEAAIVVTHWNGPVSVTTVRGTGPYWGIHSAPCCYGGAVVAGVATGVALGTAVAAATSPRVVYAVPAVAIYPAPTVVYAPAGYYYVP